MKIKLLPLLIIAICAQAQIFNPANDTTSVAVTNDTTTNATMYPVWVTANTGNSPLKVSSTLMTWNPSTGVFTIPSLAATTKISTGTAPTACGSATGCFAATEANTAGTPTAGQSYFRFGSTAHDIKWSLNNGAEGALPVNSGGTGLASFTAHNVLTGGNAGTALGSVAPGTAGNVLTSDGTDWGSSAPRVGNLAAWTTNGAITTSNTYFSPGIGGGTTQAAHIAGIAVTGNITGMCVSPLADPTNLVTWTFQSAANGSGPADSTLTMTTPASAGWAANKTWCTTGSVAVTAGQVWDIRGVATGGTTATVNWAITVSY